MKNIISVVVLLLTQSCSAFESDYEKLMNPIKKIKLAEKKSGKANPVFDGVVEPDFPDEKENDKTLEGVDSNHDGVRDDIEIWINRTAEDEYIRGARKDYYKKFAQLMLSIANNSLESIVHENEERHLEVGGCLTVLYEKYDEEYIKKYHDEAVLLNNKNLSKAFANSNLRSIALDKYNSYRFAGVLGGRNNNYCLNQEYADEYKKRLEQAILKNKKR